MKLWIDDVRPAPEGYLWCKSVEEAKRRIVALETARDKALQIAEANLKKRHDIVAYQGALRIAGHRNIELIDTDHDAGDYAFDGGDYIRLLGWLEETGRNYPIRIHSANVVGVQNMRRIIERNGWKEIR